MDSPIPSGLKLPSCLFLTTVSAKIIKDFYISSSLVISFSLYNSGVWTDYINIPMGKLGIREVTFCPLTATINGPSEIMLKTPLPFLVEGQALRSAWALMVLSASHWPRLPKSKLEPRPRWLENSGRQDALLEYLDLCVCEICSVMSDSLQPHGLHSPWNSPGQNTRVGILSLLQGIFPTQGLNPDLPHCRWILYQLSHKGSPGG